MDPSVNRAVLDALASRIPALILLVDASASTRRRAWAFGRRIAGLLGRASSPSRRPPATRGKDPFSDPWTATEAHGRLVVGTETVERHLMLTRPRWAVAVAILMPPSVLLAVALACVGCGGRRRRRRPPWRRTSSWSTGWSSLSASPDSGDRMRSSTPWASFPESSTQRSTSRPRRSSSTWLQVGRPRASRRPSGRRATSPGG